MKQFSKAGQLEMTLQQRSLHILLYQDSLKIEKNKSYRYQELLEEQVTVNAKLQKGQIISRTKLLHSLVQSLYSRTEADFQHGNFRIKGDTVDVYPSYADDAFRIHFFGVDQCLL